MWGMLFFLLLMYIYIPFLVLKNEKSTLYFRIIVIVSNISLIFLSLSSFYPVRRFSFLGVLILFGLCILSIILNILFVITKTIKTKAIKQLVFLIPIMCSLLFSFLIEKNQLSEKIALKIEFKRYKNELDSYITNNVENKNIRVFNNYVGIIWDPGFLDTYSVIIYDKHNNLDMLYHSSADTYMDKEMYSEFQEAFRYPRIVNVIKIEDHYFRCNMHE